MTRSRITARYQREPMRIKTLNNSDVLKPRQLLATFKGSKFCSDTAFSRLQRNLESGGLQFYRQREEPVPGTGRVKHRRLFRHPRTTNERRADFSNSAAKEILEPQGVALKLRQRRNSHALPNAYDDLSIRYQRSWKKHRGAQRKTVDSIDRRIHGPPLWT
jgi:hypothetical protein